MSTTTPNVHEPAASGDIENVKYQEIMTETPFSETSLSPFLLEAIDAMGHKNMTRIQEASIPVILSGRNMTAKAHTGSGKSLAFLLPAIDLIHKANMKLHHGTGVIVLTPTRELALQLYNVATQLIAATNITIGLAIGGTSRQKEANHLCKGASIVIATPGRLCDHLNNTPGFKTDKLFMLILDEADMLLEYGFQQELEAILRMLPGPQLRQVCFFSATMSNKCLEVPHMSVDKETLVQINTDLKSSAATRAHFEQGYIICPPEQRFLLLYTFMKRRSEKKIIVFLSSRDSVEFYYEFLRFIGMTSILMLDGGMKQKQRMETYNRFCNTQSGVLLATNVAARGLDLPAIDYVIQFDPPESVESYIHRSGRACRGDSTKKGVGLLFLMSHETKFISFLKAHNVSLFEFEFPTDKIINVQAEMENLIATIYYLRRKAQNAYRSFISAYASHHLKKVFNVNKIDLECLGKSFGLTEVPRVDVPGISLYKNMEREAAKAAAKAAAASVALDARKKGGDKAATENPSIDKYGNVGIFDADEGEQDDTTIGNTQGRRRHHKIKA